LFIDEELKVVDDDLKKIEAEIERLNEKKVKLMQKRGSLKERKSEEIVKKLESQDWETSGMNNNNLTVININYLNPVPIVLNYLIL
jgi:predicted nuclease with TOPRIM domain